MDKVKPKRHNLKTWPGFFTEIRNGEKTADLRKNDRGFQRGDELMFQEFIPPVNGKDETYPGFYTGSFCLCIVTAVLEGFTGLAPGYCVLSMRQPVSSSGFDKNLAGKRSDEGGADE